MAAAFGYPDVAIYVLYQLIRYEDLRLNTVEPLEIGGLNIVAKCTFTRSNLIYVLFLISKRVHMHILTLLRIPAQL